MRATTSFLHRSVRQKVRRQRGQTLVEYGLILTFISVLAIIALSQLGTKVKGVYTTINSQLAVAGTGGPAGGSAPNGHPGQ